MEIDTKLVILFAIGIFSTITGWVIDMGNLVYLVVLGQLSFVETLLGMTWRWIHTRIPHKKVSGR